MIPIPLPGGRTTAGVVRIGDTVRRPRSANSTLVRVLLQHLAASGFGGSPRWLGTDEAGREIFSYMEGEVPAELGRFDDPALSAAATLIRRFHDGATDLATHGEVVCHNDLSPCNFVFRDHRPVAMIDFDAAAPGTRAHDIGYAAWLWLDVGSPRVQAEEQGRRFRLFIDAYGEIDRYAVVRSMMERQSALAVEGRGRGDVAMAEWADVCLRWTQTHAFELMGS